MLKAQFQAVIADIKHKFTTACAIPSKTWQSVEAPQPMPELFNYSFSLDLSEVRNVPDLRDAIQPNLPWADNHFIKERISGKPINPGTTWREWPYAGSAAKHRREGEEDPQFDHSYAERYWPTFANGTIEPLHGIRFKYGDLGDLIVMLGEDPLTRQAYLPVWFPEDLAAARDHKRVPCTLGYHFIRRENRLHCIYPMRSCDFVRHFRDDVYLTLRLQEWILGNCKRLFPKTWGPQVHLGTFTMHITSLHLFEQDKQNIINSFKGA